ncbi:hypothetical protein WMY93_007557 [Mugilogobius chulae]|uniref:Uncharacterized protein n=1 Tax=Mugilogobius chulae TaxID=88201 RepID=A0AAW0PGE3_9GOBI
MDYTRTLGPRAHTHGPQVVLAPNDHNLSSLRDPVHHRGGRHNHVFNRSTWSRDPAPSAALRSHQTLSRPNADRRHAESFTSNYSLISPEAACPGPIKRVKRMIKM